MKRMICLLLGLSVLLLHPARPARAGDPDASGALAGAGEASSAYPYQRYAAMSPEEIVAELTLEQKAAQMVQPFGYLADEQAMQAACYGSIYGTDVGPNYSFEWSALVDRYQQAAISSESGIPFLYAQDDVHGVGLCLNAVYFPQNIGQGAANDEELAYQVGRITADEAKLCHMLWNLYPCVAQSNDLRWGRNYECYGSDPELIIRLGTAYTRGLVDGGVIACAKHYFGDGNTVFGTGEQSDYPRLIDRGDAVLSDEEIRELLRVYQAQIDAGVQTIMISYSSLNGVKMHENGEYIRLLREEMGFEGIIMSDSEGLQNTSPETYEEQIILGINSGIDLLMEGERYDETIRIITDAVHSGRISMERIDSAVTRIIRVKKEIGLFDDPLCTNLTTAQQKTGSPESRAVAERLVEKSLVLLKNENGILPLKRGTKVYITGPAADNAPAQCGGWTLGWVRSTIPTMSGVTTIRQAFVKHAGEYGIEVITNPDQADSADVVILCVGEESYAEWFGDTEEPALCGKHGLPGNRTAIARAKALGKPTVVCIIAGRQVFLDAEDYACWDSVVMCYLPGSEGQGISNVLCGYADFTGRLPEPWYGSVDQIGTDDCVFATGYGLSYPADFMPLRDPAALPVWP